MYTVEICFKFQDVNMFNVQIFHLSFSAGLTCWKDIGSPPKYSSKLPYRENKI